MIEIQTCPVCTGTNFSSFLTCRDVISQEQFNLIKCTQCKLVVTSPRPAPGDLKKYYVSDDYTSHKLKAKSLVDKLYMIARIFTLKWKVSIVNKYSEGLKEKKILDYGCGTGEFLRVLARRGWKTFGVEPSLIARQNISQTVESLVVETLEQLGEENEFDTITLWHVLEHVQELDSTLEKLKALLKFSGTLFIAVPNHTSWDGKHYEQWWAGYDVPRHLWHFTKSNLEILLKKKDLRLTGVLPMRLDATYVSLLSEKSLSKGRLTLSGLLNGLINGLRSNSRARKTREYSSLIYIVKK